MWSDAIGQSRDLSPFSLVCMNMRIGRSEVTKERQCSSFGSCSVGKTIPRPYSFEREAVRVSPRPVHYVGHGLDMNPIKSIEHVVERIVRVYSSNIISNSIYDVVVVQDRHVATLLSLDIIVALSPLVKRQLK